MRLFGTTVGTSCEELIQAALDHNLALSDVFGFDAGRTREYCDLFAEHGFLVVLPDYFRADFHMNHIAVQVVGSISA